LTAADLSTAAEQVVTMVPALLFLCVGVPVAAATLAVMRGLRG
jgi:hypothetical protein